MRYDAELPPIISIVRWPGRPVILVPEKSQPKKKVFSLRTSRGHSWGLVKNFGQAIETLRKNKHLGAGTHDSNVWMSMTPGVEKNIGQKIFGLSFVPYRSKFSSTECLTPFFFLC